jgi:hypothetical protein
VSGPAIALVAIGGTVYTVIGIYMAIGLAMLFTMGSMFGKVSWWQAALCLLTVPLWAPGLILYWVILFFALPFGG